MNIKLVKDNKKVSSIFHYGIIIATLFLGIVPAISFAYTETTDGGEMIAVVDPASPGSFSNVDINIKSFEIDLDRSEIIWYIDGKEVKSGI